MESTKISVWKYVVGILLFWVLFFFGGLIPMLLNALAPMAGRYEEGSLGYAVLKFLAQPIGVVIAIYALWKVTDEVRPMLCLVNCVIGACMVGCVVAFTLLMRTATLYDTAVNIITVAVSIVGACIMWKQLKELQSKEE